MTVSQEARGDSLDTGRRSCKLETIFTNFLTVTCNKTITPNSRKTINAHNSFMGRNMGISRSRSLWRFTIQWWKVVVSGKRFLGESRKATLHSELPLPIENEMQSQGRYASLCWSHLKNVCATSLIQCACIEAWHWTFAIDAVGCCTNYKKLMTRMVHVFLFPLSVAFGTSETMRPRSSSRTIGSHAWREAWYIADCEKSRPAINCRKPKQKKKELTDKVERKD